MTRGMGVGTSGGVWREERRVEGEGSCAGYDSSQIVTEWDGASWNATGVAYPLLWLIVADECDVWG